jgi:hypothetical protein
MQTAPHSFRRLVLGLQASAPLRSTRLAAELAGLLHLEMLGLFLDDTSLHNLARIPFARELRPLGGGWHPIELDRLSHELELSARSAERMFAEMAKHLATRCAFEIVRASTAEAIMSVSRRDDIVVIAQPPRPADRATQQFASLMDAAFRSDAAVLLVPSRLIRTTGPVVAIAAASDDSSIGTAAMIASAAREDLVIVLVDGGGAASPGIGKLADSSGPRVRTVRADRGLLTNPDAFTSAFQNFRERLVVVARGVLDHETVVRIASVRRIPVLVVEP